MSGECLLWVAFSGHSTVPIKYWSLTEFAIQYPAPLWVEHGHLLTYFKREVFLLDGNKRKSQRYDLDSKKNIIALAHGSGN